MDSNIKMRFEGRIINQCGKRNISRDETYGGRC